MMTTTRTDWVRTLAERACEGFGDTGDGQFTTANYQGAVYREFGTLPPVNSVERALTKRHDIVRLSRWNWQIRQGGAGDPRS